MIRGWLFLLALLLTVWEPLSLGLFASSVVVRLLDRPEALAVLAIRLAVTALGLAAGLALFAGKPHGPRLAQAALVLSTAVALVVSLTPWFPSNRPPGTTLPLAAATLAYNGAWLLYLGRSKQVKALTGRRAAPVDGRDGSRVPPAAP